MDLTTKEIGVIVVVGDWRGWHNGCMRRKLGVIANSLTQSDVSTNLIRCPEQFPQEAYLFLQYRTG